METEADQVSIAAEPVVEPGQAKTYDEQYVKSLRAEAAASRIKVRELEASALRARIAGRFNVPDALVEFLTGSNEAELTAQAEKLALQIKTSVLGGSLALPAAGGRNPANGGEQAAKHDEQEHFEGLKRRVPALMNRVLRN